MNHKITLVTYKHQNAYKATAGLTVNRMLTNQIGISGYFDYSYSKPEFIYSAIAYEDSDPEDPEPVSFKETIDFSYLFIEAKGLRFSNIL